MVEGESGILACSPRDFKPKYEPSKRRLTWPNGAVATLFSAEDFDSLRGPQFDGAWCDELCKWRYAQEAWDNLQFGLRLGEHPKQIVTTTPRPIRLLKDIILRSDTAITKGSTMENLVNLAPPFRKAVVDKYKDTRIGRQELNAEILDDVPGALWSRGMIDETRIRPVDSVTPIALPHFERVLVSVDPAKEIGEAAAETGIMVVGKDQNGKGYLLEDLSLSGSPEEWGRAAVMAYDDWAADMIVYEANQGGEMVAAVLRQAAKALKDEGLRTADFVPVKPVHATRGKYVRAEPVSQLYEQKKISHVGYFPELEDQLCEYTADGSMGYSPDRMDAMVWGFTELMVGSIAHEGLMDYYRQQAQAVADRLKGVNPALPAASVSLKGPLGINTAYGMSGTKYLLDDKGLFQVKQEDVKPLTEAGYRVIIAEAN
jgi:phage terminase large subunit-like protein